MKELSLVQKAMLNGSVCPYCKNPSEWIGTTEGRMVGCRACGAWTRTGPDGKPVGRLAKPDLLRAMDMVAVEIDTFLERTEQDRADLYKELSGELGIPIEYMSPYKMSLSSLLRIMRHIETYSENLIRIYDGVTVSVHCPRHKSVIIGSEGCHGCPEHLFHVIDKVTNTVVCDADMSYGNFVKGGNLFNNKQE